jgi:putative PEP-CTERM system TPR-repeat lipoprotein
MEDSMTARSSPARRLIARALIGAAAMLLIAAAPNEPVSTDRESQRYYEDAQKQLEKGDPRAAVIQLKNALRVDAKNASARHLLGLIYLRSGDGELAEKEIRSAIQNGYPEDQALSTLAEAYMAQNKFEALLADFPPANRPLAVETQIRLLRGYAYASLGKREDAVKAFTDAATLNPKDARPLAGLARLDLEQRRFADAEDRLKHALEINPQSAEALALMGETSRRQGKVEPAFEYYDRALAQDRRNRTALIGRSTVLLDRGELDKADPDIKALIAMAPRDPIARYLQAVSQARHKDVKGALATLQKEQALSNYAPAIYLQSVLQFQQNQVEQAVAGLERYIEMAPTDTRARKLLGNAYLRKNDSERAVAMLTPALETSPDDVQTLSLLGSAYLMQRQYDKATQLLERAAAIDPKNPETQTRLAAGELQAGDAARAIKTLEEALDLNPTETQANLMLVMTHLRDRNFEAAREAARRFQVAQPNSPLPVAMQGMVASAEGDRAAARRHFEKALEIQPDYFAVRMSLAQLDIEDGNPNAAAGRYEDILKRDKNNIPALLAMANLQLRLGKQDDAVTWLERARAADLTALEPRFALVDVYMRRKDANKAMVVAAELTTIAPQSARAAVALANAQLASGDKDAAIASYRRAAALQPNAPQPIQALARALIESGDEAGGRSALQEALALAPDYEPVRADLIALDLKADRKDAALKLAEEWRAAKPDNPAAVALVGDVLMRVQRYDEAIKTFEALMKQAPSAAAATLLANAKQRAGKPNPLEPLESYVAAHPADLRGQQTLAQNYLAAKDMAKARKAFEAVIELAPSDPAALNNLAWIYQSAGDPRAAALAQRAHALAPGSPDIADTLGWILVQRGELDQAMPILESAAAKLPDNGDVRYHLAAAWAKRGDQDKARRILQPLVASGDKFDSAEEARALLRTMSAQ